MSTLLVWSSTTAALGHITCSWLPPAWVTLVCGHTASQGQGSIHAAPPGEEVEG